MNLLLIDNNDSFTHNLRHLISDVCKVTPDIVNYEEISGVETDLYTGFIISAGPGEPLWYPDYKKIFSIRKPVFGVCLGMQILCCHFGGSVARLKGCVHGVQLPYVYKKTIRNAAVYNSLHCEDVPDCFDIFARRDEQIMGIRHTLLPFAGVQFHPESFMTEDGGEIISDVFKDIGLM